MGHTSFSKIKRSSHNTQLYPICIVGGGLTGQALAHLLTQKGLAFCLIEARETLKYKTPYISTAFIQNKTYKLIRKFFYTKPPIIHKISKLEIFGQLITKPPTFASPKPFGYMLDIEYFINHLKVSTKNLFLNTYVKDILIGPKTIHLIIEQHGQEFKINTNKLVIADGAVSNTSKLLQSKGYKININKKFKQGAEAIIYIPPSERKKLNPNQIYFGLFPEYKGYGMWIAPYNKSIKIGFALDQKCLINKKIKISDLMQTTIKRAAKHLRIKQYKIKHIGYKLIPTITAAQLHNITLYQNLWQIGDAGGFVGPLLLDGIYAGLNSAIDTYKDLEKPEREKSAAKSVVWAAKYNIPGNSLYTVRLLKYMTTSAILKEFYNLIFANKVFFFIASKIAQYLAPTFLKLFFKYKKEI